MSSIALKFSSLLIRTLSKPIATLIKRQAREHDGFRQTCISFAQALHRVDMRLRLGILRDSAAIEKQVAREAAEVASKKHKHAITTVKTEAQTLTDEKAAKEKLKPSEAPKAASKPRIRPLSEAKAIESGATFISEAFLFSVAGSLIVFEAWRSRRRENTRREDVAERLAELEESERAARRALVELEREVVALRTQHGKGTGERAGRILPQEIWIQEEKDEKEDGEKARGWLSRISSYILSKKTPSNGERGEVGPAEKILAASELALAAKHQRALEESARESARESAAKPIETKKAHLWQEKVAESKLDTHDLALPMLMSGGHTSYLQILVLETKDLNEASFVQSKARVQHMVGVAGGRKKAIVLLLEKNLESQTDPEDLQAFMLLKKILVDGGLSCPTIPIPHASSLFPMLQDYLQKMQKSTTQAPSTLGHTKLIAHATGSGPSQLLSVHDANVVFDIFSSLQDLEEATRTRDGQAKLYTFLDSTTAKEVVDFWVDEWIV